MSRSVNDIVYQTQWDEINSLSDRQKILACLNKKILTQDDIEDGFFTSRDLTDWLYEINMTAEEIEEL